MDWGSRTPTSLRVLGTSRGWASPAGQEGTSRDKPSPWRYQAPMDPTQELDPHLEGPRGGDDFSSLRCSTWRQINISALRPPGLSLQDNGLTEKFKQQLSLLAVCVALDVAFSLSVLPPLHFSLFWLLSQLAFVVTACAKTAKNSSCEP